ncbi:MAG: alpha/beta fold hydrolase [Actinobacteria bacterium]|nr:alpha/beta fold hydrolase [Actinomycetota bacterium]
MTGAAAVARVEVDRDLYPFRSRFLRTTSGATVHYVDEGEGDPTLLFLHGNPTWSFLYRDLIAGLRDRVRCVAIDYPGFGLSSAADGFDHRAESQHEVVREVVDQLRLDRIVLVVQDWGGPIGLALAERRPELVAGIVAGNTFAWPLAGDRRMATFSWIMGGPLGSAAVRSFNGVWRFFMWRGFRRRPPAPVMAMYAAPFRHGDRGPTAVFPRELLLATDLLVRAERGLERLADRPALLLWGEHDFGFRAAERQRWEEALPRHRTVSLDASHFWPEDQPQVAVTEIRRWLDETPGLADGRD